MAPIIFGFILHEPHTWMFCQQIRLAYKGFWLTACCQLTKYLGPEEFQAIMMQINDVIGSWMFILKGQYRHKQRGMESKCYF